MRPASWLAIGISEESLPPPNVGERLGRQALRNVAWSLTGEFAMLAVSAGYIVVLARFLGAAGFGTYSFLIGFYSVLFLFSDLGVNTYFQREWSRSILGFARDYPLLVNLRLVLGALLLLVAMGYAVASREGLSAVFLLAFLVFVVEQVRDLNNVYFVATQRFAIRTVSRLGDRVLAALFGSAALIAGWGLEGVFTAHLAARLLSVGIQWLRGPFALRRDLPLRASATILARSYPFFFITLFNVVYVRADILLLKWMSDYQAVGWYGAAYSFVNMLNMSLAAVGVGLFPVVARIAEENQERLEAVAEMVVRWLVTPALGVAVVGGLFAEDLVRLLFSAEFAPAAGPLRLLLLAQVFTTASYTYGTLLYVRGREKTAARLIALLMAANVAANLILIPRFGIRGAAAATLLTEAVNLVALVRLVRIRFAFSGFAKWAVACLVAAVSALAISTARPLLAAAVAAAIYIVVVMATGMIRWREMGLLISARPR